MTGESGEIEGRAFLWRAGGRWIVAIEMPDWVRQEFQADAQRPKRGVILQFPEGALHLVSAPPAEAQATAVQAGEQNRSVQVLPAGVDQAGTILRHETPVVARPTGRAVLQPYAAVAVYVQSCLSEGRTVDYERIRDLTGLTSEEDIRRVVTRIQADRMEQPLTGSSACAVVAVRKTEGPALPPEETAVRGRRGPTKGYRLSPETLEQRRQKIAAKKAGTQAVES